MAAAFSTSPINKFTPIDMFDDQIMTQFLAYSTSFCFSSSANPVVPQMWILAFWAHFWAISRLNKGVEKSIMASQLLMKSSILAVIWRPKASFPKKTPKSVFSYVFPERTKPEDSCAMS